MTNLVLVRGENGFENLSENNRHKQKNKDPIHWCFGFPTFCALPRGHTLELQSTSKNQVRKQSCQGSIPRVPLYCWTCCPRTLVPSCRILHARRSPRCLVGWRILVVVGLTQMLPPLGGYQEQATNKWLPNSIATTTSGFASYLLCGVW